ncbi:glycosyltransferase [Citrifermentans bremense]|uniref:glycosyltransferase n=1 Tax=Citrifermentans bremense TaxID=60035 RepID=UPI001CF78A56|nr:glycosyltransferase [Citrifermentans bremense]
MNDMSERNEVSDIPNAGYFPFVSVIIPTYNCEAYIRLCIESVLESDYPSDRLEIVVVDNMSTDSSATVAGGYNVRVIKSTARTIAKVRNDGVQVAKGEILAFVDSDCQIPKKWISTAVKLLSRPQVGMVGAGYRVPPDAAWVEKAWLYEAKNQEKSVSFLPSGNMIVTTGLFKDLNGFDESLVTCEDADLCERAVKKGVVLLNSSDLQSIHLRNPKTLLQFFLKEKWYGFNTAISIKNGKFDMVFLFTLIFFVLHFLLLFLPSSFSVAILVLIFVLINIAVFYRLSISKKFTQYLSLLVLYYVYFCARGIGSVSYLKCILWGNHHEA